MTSILKDMHSALVLLEAEMKLLGWWQSQAPSPQALNSQEPFCIDYLSFSEWLQWVYIPKMRHFMEQTGQLPQNSNLFAIAEEAWKGCNVETQRLLQVIELLDALIMGEYQEKLQHLLSSS